MTEEERNREETLRLLVNLAVEDDPASCYEGGRALRLLRSQSTPDELRRIGVGEETIKMIWPEGLDD